MVGVSAWARAVLEKPPKWAKKGEMRPERAFERILEHMQEVISGQGLNAIVICVRLRVVCGRCARLGARGARKRS